MYSCVVSVVGVVRVASAVRVIMYCVVALVNVVGVVV